MSETIRFPLDARLGWIGVEPKDIFEAPAMASVVVIPLLRSRA